MAERGSKYRSIFETLRKEIRGGRYPAGVPLPSEERLIRRFGVSRITAVKAMDELVKEGLVYRRRGVGTFVTCEARSESGQIGLIVPGLAYGEIFPPITQEITRIAQRDGFSLMLGDISAPSPMKRAHEACRVARRFVERRVAGVVFQPLAFLKTPDRVSREILTMFMDADIPVVILDRDIAAADIPHDFVGIDNLAAGRLVGAHMMEQGAKRIHFLMRPNCASVIRDRLDGVRSALAGHLPKDHLIIADAADAKTLAKWFKRARRPDAVICESDYVAARFMATLAKFGLSAPDDVLVSGFDDVRYAEITNPQLTTVHQPCEAIAAMVYRALRERMRDREMPSRKILLPAPLVVRASTTRRRAVKS